MASTYSSNLKIELIGTGEQSGTWGTTTNTNLGTLLEEAIAGYVTQAVTDGAATVLTIPNGSSSNGRNYVIELTGALTAARTVEVPAVDKPYIFFNNTTGGFSVTVKVSGQTGVTIANGKKAIVYTNSTDVIEVANAPVTEAGTQTLTNKTLTSPTINTATLSNPTVTGVATFAAGTVSAPAITTTGDTNTGIFFPAADTIAFAEGGAEAMRIDSSGNLGIGTSSPAGRLEVSSASNIVYSTGTAGFGSFYARGSGTNASYLFMGNATSGEQGRITTENTGIITFANTASATERMRIDASGNVGIGTSSPTQKLDVYGGAGAAVSLVRAASGQNAFFSVVGNGNSFLSTSFDMIQDSTNAASLVQRANGPLYFSTNNTERMRIDSSGNVGIGASSPGAKLDVAGQRFRIGSSASDPGIEISNGTTTKGYVFYDTTNDLVTMRHTSTVTGVSVNSSGNVGIGTSSPGAKLEIATTNQSMKITGSGAANWTTVANTSRSFNYGVDATGFNIYDNTAASYRMIIDTSGNLLVGTTNALPINNRNNGFVIKSNGSWVARFPSSETDIGISTTSGNLLNFYSDNGSTAIYSGSISVNGNVTTYGSVSDYRLKEDVQPMVGGLNTISALSPVSYKWKDSDNCGEGFIAHDLQSVIPDAVIGDKDAVKDDGSPSYQQVDCSKIVVHLVAAIQELKADLDAAKAEIATLKGAA